MPQKQRQTDLKTPPSGIAPFGGSGRRGLRDGQRRGLGELAGNALRVGWRTVPLVCRVIVRSLRVVRPIRLERKGRRQDPERRGDEDAGEARIGQALRVPLADS